MPAWRGKPVRVAAAAVVGSALLASAWPVMTHWVAAEKTHTGGAVQADALGVRAAAAQPDSGSGPLAASPGAHAGQQPEIVSIGIAIPDRLGRHRRAGHGYRNPLRDVSDLVPERIDEGVDFSGSGPVYALGDAVITNATGDSAGWPGGGWITYVLTDGPAAGLMVYVAEDITPTVQVGQHVSSSTVIGDMFAGSDGIETGWAQPGGLSAESQLPEAGGIDGYGPFPTRVGLNFDELLQSLGVPPAPNRLEFAYGLLPAAYPVNW